MIPAKASAGGVIASSGSNNALALGRERKRQDAKAQPVGRGNQQEHAGGAGRDWIDQSPQPDMTGDCQSPIVPLAISP